MNEELSSQVASLKRQVFALLIAIIVVSGTLNVFLYRQASLTGKDLEGVRPQAQQIVGAYLQNKALIDSFESQLKLYGQSHPDFKPILIKYGLIPNPAAPAAPKK